MNDLDAFRETLRTTGVTDDRPLDIGRIMKDGGRLRRRRRLATGGIGVATALVLVVGGVQVGRSFGPEAPNPGAPVAAGPSSTAPVTPAVTEPPPGDGSRTPLGRVIRTGMTGAGGEIVLYMVRVEEAGLPEVRFGLMAGIREVTGEVKGKIISNEIESATSPGFHAVQGAMNVDSVDFPVFGYYVGPAKKIVSGRVTAKQKVWSENPSVVVFWFDPSDTPSGFKAKGLTAYDKRGDKLPAGNRAPGVG